MLLRHRSRRAQAQAPAPVVPDGPAVDPAGTPATGPVAGTVVAPEPAPDTGLSPDPRPARRPLLDHEAPTVADTARLAGDVWCPPDLGPPCGPRVVDVVVHDRSVVAPPVVRPDGPDVRLVDVGDPFGGPARAAVDAAARPAAAPSGTRPGGVARMLADVDALATALSSSATALFCAPCLVRLDPATLADAPGRPGGCHVRGTVVVGRAPDVVELVLLVTPAGSRYFLDGVEWDPRLLRATLRDLQLRAARRP